MASFTISSDIGKRSSSIFTATLALQVHANIRHARWLKFCARHSSQSSNATSEQAQQHARVKRQPSVAEDGATCSNTATLIASIFRIAARSSSVTHCRRRTNSSAHCFLFVASNNGCSATSLKDVRPTAFSRYSSTCFGDLSHAESRNKRNVALHPTTRRGLAAKKVITISSGSERKEQAIVFLSVFKCSRPRAVYALAQGRKNKNVVRAPAGLEACFCGLLRDSRRLRYNGIISVRSSFTP